MQMKQAVAAAMALGVLLVIGCKVTDDKKDGNDNVKITTPFGGMQVKTNDATVLENIGLPGYPGAVVAKNDHDKGSADVNFSFGSFHLKVNAASYRTTDKPDMVMAFYRKALTKYGDVIECQNNKSIGTPTETSEGLSCSDDGDKHVSVADDWTGKSQLKAGSKQHQHIVEIDPQDDGTKFGLVALDLPGHISVGDNGQDKQ
jgi:hypothetical protein